MTNDLRSLALATLFPGFDGTTAPIWLLDLVGQGLGGVVLFDRNVGDDASVRALTDSLRDSRPDVLVAVDEEGGDVTRLDASVGSAFPGLAALGVVDDIDLTRRMSVELAERLGRAGISLNLAPVADVDADPLNPIIGVRAFGADPELVARHTAAFVTGHRDAGVAATLKHFPGHGSTTEDSHVTTPTVAASAATLRSRDLPPFRAGIAAGAPVVLTAHVVYPALDATAPATMSRPILTDLLRGELGFDGVVMTDGLDMHAISRTVGHNEGAVRALVAGADALCVGGESVDPDRVERLVGAIVAAVEQGRLPENRLREAAERVRRLAHEYARPAAHSGAAPAGEAVAQQAVRIIGDTRVDGPALVIELQNEPSIAAGFVPWGVGAPLAQMIPGTEVRTVHEGDPLPRVEGDARPLVVGVRATQRNPWQVDVVRQLRAVRPDLVVVDHGTPAAADVLGEHAVLTADASAATAWAAARRLTGWGHGRRSASGYRRVNDRSRPNGA
jgi:beta-N-acetylhexosaminidase